MELGDLIALKGVVPQLRARNKKQALLELAAKAADITGIDASLIFETILQRERLGTTALGRGIAIPHGRLKGLKGITGIAVQLAKPVDFEAMDDQPVDLVILLLAPEDSGADHLKALARIARVLKQPNKLAKLRAASDSAAIYALLTSEEASHAA